MKFSKKVDGTYYVVEAAADTARKKINIVTAYMSKTKGGSDIQALDMEQSSPQHTSEPPHGPHTSAKSNLARKETDVNEQDSANLAWAKELQQDGADHAFILAATGYEQDVDGSWHQMGREAMEQAQAQQEADTSSGAARHLPLEGKALETETAAEVGEPTKEELNNDNYAKKEAASATSRPGVTGQAGVTGITDAVSLESTPAVSRSEYVGETDTADLAGELSDRTIPQQGREVNGQDWTGGTDNEVLLHEGSQRESGAGAGGQTGAVAESSERAGQRRTEGQGTVLAGRFAAAAGELRSSKELGIKDGLDSKTIRLIPADTDPELQEIQARAQGMGMEVQFLDHALQVKNRTTRRIANVSAVFDSNNGRILVCATGTRYSVSAQYGHEEFHALAAANRDLVSDTWRALEQRFGAERREALALQAFQDFDGIYGKEDEDLHFYQEEVLADLYGDLNRKGRGLDPEMQRVVQEMADRPSLQTPGEAREAGELRQDGARYRIETTEDGKRFVVIDEGQDVFKGKPRSAWAAIAKRVLLDKFAGQTLPLSDNDLARLRRAQAGEYAYPSFKLDIRSPQYEAKMKSAPELNNLLETAEYSYWAEDTKNHPEAEYGFDYYKTEFRVGDKTFEGLINIGNSRKGRIFYDITRIREIPATPASAQPLWRKSASGSQGPLSENSISKTEQPDNPENPLRGNEAFNAARRAGEEEQRFSLEDEKAENDTEEADEQDGVEDARAQIRQQAEAMSQAQLEQRIKTDRA